MKIVPLDRISNKCLFLIIVSILLSSIGAFSVKYIYRERKSKVKNINYNFKRIKALINLLFIVYFIGQILYLFKVKSIFGTFNLLSIDSTLYLLEQRNGGLANLGIISLTNSLDFIIIILIIWYIKNNGIKINLILKFIFIVYFYLCNPSRTAMITLVFFIMFAILHFIRYSKLVNKTRVNFKKIFKIAFISFITGIIVIVFFYQMGERLNKNAVKGISNQGVITQPYLYVAGNVVALDKLINNSPEYSQGKKSFYTIYKIIEKFTGIKFDLYTVEPFVRIPYEFNTYTSLSVYYSDFGVIGIIVLPLIVSIITMYLYLRYSKREDFFAIFALSYILVITVSTFNVNKFPWFITWIQIGQAGCIWLIIKKFCIKKKLILKK